MVSMAQTINIQRCGTRSTATSRCRSRSTARVIDPTASPYNAKGDGVTDDNDAIQAALDAAQLVQGTVVLPNPTDSYLVRNLKISAQTRLIGQGMNTTHLKQKVGATGTVLREKSILEGNAGNSGGIWVTDLGIIGNNVAGSGLNLGNVDGGLNFNAGVQRVYATNFPAGTAISINGNAMQCQYLWGNSSGTGIIASGGGNSWVGLWAESNTTQEILIESHGDSFFHLQTEGLGSVPAVKITGTDNSIYRPYCAIGGDNATHIIRVELGAARNHIYDAFGSTGAFTFTNLIYSVGEARGTGSEQYHIPEWFDQAAVQKPRRPEVDSAYSASINFDLNLADKFYIGVTNTSAFTIIQIQNSTGGAMGTITWSSAFKLAGAFTNPAGGQKQRFIEFYVRRRHPLVRDEPRRGRRLKRGRTVSVPAGQMGQDPKRKPGGRRQPRRRPPGHPGSRRRRRQDGQREDRAAPRADGGAAVAARQGRPDRPGPGPGRADEYANMPDPTDWVQNDPEGAASYAEAILGQLAQMLTNNAAAPAGAPMGDASQAPPDVGGGSGPAY
jgi:hypothetical protein